MNALTQRDVHDILDDLARIKELTELMRHAHFDVAFRKVYCAVMAEERIRSLILGRSLGSVEVEGQMIPGLVKDSVAWLETGLRGEVV